ncbi:LuxR C-terminal-related transcriptional regulator [Geodermatophilus telluris]|uniref:LuxR C-terminal-related transcriptional regulator n=1 Tax=Geodermatophilus telluris TaxID=1190417 RepID=UPI001FE0491D|nr:LuxR C-terminal-related transcriptional regulator [Geodermatophilus telluris]
MVARPRLSERLDRGGDAALTLVSAPAGFGKTTLLTEWLATADRRSTAWLSLDDRDNDPNTFWTYLIAALQTAVPGVGAGAFALLREPHASLDEVLATLVNELDAVPDDLVLVLDDYHAIATPEIHERMAFLVEHLPPHVHLVIATRADPALPVARWRARGELVEIRADELRFTPEEAAAYLNEAMGLALTAEHIAALEARTEGWIAALQLAALSMQGRDDPAGFIAGFAGDARYIVDYLVEEVLQRQPDDVRHFLLRTSILNRLTGPLCDAVVGRDGGRPMLEGLERANLFLVPLDDRRTWYRYHHLFADVLQAHLLDEQPGTVPDLHRRAAEWFERSGERAEAIEHALAAADLDRAADLLERVIPDMNRHRGEATLRRWLESLPDEVLRARPLLSAGYVGALMSTGEVRGAEARLEEVERWLAGPPGGADGGVVDEARRRLPGQIAMFRSAQALVSGDVDASMRHARRALDLAAPGDLATRGGPEALIGLAFWTTGDLDEGYRWYAQGMASLDEAGYATDVVGGAVTLAEIRIAQGRLRDAMSIYRRGLRRAEQTVPALKGAADMHVGMSELFRERDDLEAARGHLVRSQELGPSSDLPKNAYRRRLAMARLCEVEGDLDGAFELLDEAERCFNNDYSPDVRPIPALRARMEAAHGRLGDALDWVGERGLSADDDLSYVREYEHVTLARVLLARHAVEDGAGASLRAATGLLDRLLSAAEAGRRAGSVIEILVLQALAAQACGDMPAALAALRRALSLAEAEDYVRTFADEGAPMTALLRSAGASGSISGYVRRLIIACGVHDDEPVAQRLVEPLSARELDVLRLLATDLDGPRIASELFVSLNTVRTHTKNIYAKLGVTNRRAAVRRGQELDLVRGR